MDDVLNFIVENYIWFIAGGIILLMTIIGYFAEKTKFGKVPNESKTKKKEKIVKQQDSASRLEKKIDEIAAAEVPVQETMEDAMENLDAIEYPDVNVEEKFVEPEVETVDATETIEVPEDLYAGLDGTPNAYKTNNESIEELEKDLPDIDTLKNEIEEDNTEDDDIWKF